MIEGRSVTTDKLVFEITVDSTSGEVKLDQKRAIVHTDPDHSEYDESSPAFAADLD